jgi:hypothetical protein
MAASCRSGLDAMTIQVAFFHQRQVTNRMPNQYLNIVTSR